MIMSLNIKSFVRAGNLIPGGFTGLSLLIQRSCSTFLGLTIPYSIINISLNAVPAFIGYKIIGKKFTIFSVGMIVLNSFLVDLMPVTPITYDPLLVSVFGGLLFGFEASLYSIIFQFVSTQVIERLNTTKQKSTLFIITENTLEMEKKIMEYTHHGATKLFGEGCYSGKERVVLYTVVSGDEVKDVIQLCREIDPHSFINVMKSTEIGGRFYSKPIE